MDAPDADALHSARSHNSGYQEERRNSEESTNSQGLRRWGRVPRPPQSSVECEETKRLKLKKQKRELTEATRNLVSESIHNSRFCKHLGEQVVNSLCDRLEFYAFAAGDIIIRQGEQGDHLFITEAGDLEVSIDGKVINSMGPGDAFGCMALLYNVPRSATVTAKEDAGLWLLGGSYFRKLVREHSEKTQKENLRLLEQVHVLDGLSNAQKSHVGSVALLNETFTAGSVVAEFGEECKRLWVVKRGTLSVVDGGERIGKKLSGGDKVREVCAGGCFGEQYLKIDASKRIEVNLVAATDCDVVCVLIDKLASLLGEGDVAQLLERAYVGLTLRKTPWFESLPAQDKSHVLHTQVTIEPCREGQAVSSLQRVGSMAYLVLVVEGTFHDSADARRCLQRGGWAQAEDFDRLQMLCSSKAYESPKASAKNALRPDRLVAGETGGRIALVPLEGIARSLSGDMELPEPAELMDYISKVLIISRLPVLKRLANFQVCSISKALDSTDPWRPGEIVFDQGEDGDKFYIVMSGGVRVDVDGVLLRELGKGACFGERALLFDEKRSGKVTVTEPDTRFWVGTRDVFEKFVTKNMRDDLRERAKLQDWTLSLKNLRHVRMIGVGAFGSVRLVEHVKTGARYALKRIKKEDGQVPMEIQEECNLLGMASHPFVLQLVKSFQTEKSLYILTELITGGQLYEQMRDKMGTASRRHAQFYTGSLVLILEALHLAGVAYRDLKPENVMLDSQGYVKLVDFGLAKDMRDQSKTFTIVGTVYYMAPDIFVGRGYGLEVDFWSLGIMLYELVCGRLPFGNESAEEDDIIAAVLEETLAFPPKYNDNAGKNLMERLLCKDPAERIGSRDGWQEVKEHKFFKMTGSKGDLFTQILGREMNPPLMPEGEEYSKEAYLSEKVSMSDIEEFADEEQLKVQEHAKAVWKKLDPEGQGVVQTEELALLLAQTDSDLNRNQIDALVEAVDTKADGITFKTFCAFLEQSDLDAHAVLRALES